MKAVKLFQDINLIVACALIFSIGAMAQGKDDSAASKKRERVAAAKTDKEKAENPAASPKPKPQTSAVVETKKPDAPETVVEADKQAAPTPVDKKTDDKKTDDKSMRRETLSEEEAAIIPYYNNYMKEYRLGPQDVISVEVFGQCPDYCKTAITVPPTATISYPLIKGGILVAGKTVEQVAEEIKKQLNEYIIDPDVTVTLDKVGSARYSVLGDVGTPGVKMMERRMSVYEAIVESGGVLRTGDSKRVTIVRQTATGLTPIVVNLQEIARGKGEMVYLVPGDQVIVPGNKIKKIDTVLEMIGKVSIFKLLFGGGF